MARASKRKKKISRYVQVVTNVTRDEAEVEARRIIGQEVVPS
jgi:hypothetical protein